MPELVALLRNEAAAKLWCAVVCWRRGARPCLPVLAWSLGDLEHVGWRQYRDGIRTDYRVLVPQILASLSPGGRAPVMS